LVRLKGRQVAVNYIEVLKNNLLPFLGGLRRKKRFIFQKDNAPIHTAKKQQLEKKKMGCHVFYGQYKAQISTL